MIQGKGFYVWRVDRVMAHMGTQDPAVAAQAAVDAGIEHLIVKIADGDEPYPIPEQDENGHQEIMTAAFIHALREAGLTVWGWAFAYGPPRDPDTQARRFVERARQFQMNGLVVNAENNGRYVWSSEAGAVAARKYMACLRNLLSDVPELLVGLSTYRYINYHPNFPFSDFMDGCDVAMPQIYWVNRGEGDAIRNLRGSYEEYKTHFPSKLFIPTGAAYGESYNDSRGRYFWSATPRQVEHLLHQARAMNLSAVTFWSWEHALNDPQNLWFNQDELWQTIARYDFQGAGIPTVPDGELLELGIGDPGYADGLYPQYPQANFIPFSWGGRTMKYAESVAHTPSSVWALWRPDILISGLYDIAVWVPGRNATTRRAVYQLHGVVGQNEPVQIEVNQNRFFDDWVSLGLYELDANNPLSGQINLTNATGEEERKIAFARIRWQHVERDSDPHNFVLADGYDAPIGTPAERRSDNLWPGHWFDANPFGSYYRLRGNVYAYHTGADLNLNQPHWDSDQGKNVYAVASGIVTASVWRPNWGNIIVIRHDPLEIDGPHHYARYAHLGRMMVRAGQRVQRGQPLATVGQDAHGGPFHLHFDISPTEVMAENPGDWPALDRSRLMRHYIDPLVFIRDNRPRQ